jgi:hypothetical protein
VDPSFDEFNEENTKGQWAFSPRNVNTKRLNLQTSRAPDKPHKPPKLKSSKIPKSSKGQKSPKTPPVNDQPSRSPRITPPDVSNPSDEKTVQADQKEIEEAE